MPEEVPAGTLRGVTGCGCHFWPPLHPLPRCPGCRALVLAVLHPSRSQHLPGLVQPRSLKCKRALGSLNNSPSVWSCNDWPLPRTSWRKFQKPSQLAHPQMSSGSEQNLIFPLQGEEERWKNRVRYARTRKNHSPSLPAPLSSSWGQGIRKAPMAAPGPSIKFGATLAGSPLQGESLH